MTRCWPTGKVTLSYLMIFIALACGHPGEDKLERCALIHCSPESEFDPLLCACVPLCEETECPEDSRWDESSCVCQEKIDNGDSTVTDYRTNFTWEQKNRENRSDPYTHSESADYCAELSLGGLHDWRLPDLEELKTLVFLERGAPTIDQRVFHYCLNGGYWTSTLNENSPDQAYFLSFEYGLQLSRPLDAILYARCVSD